MIDKFTKDVTHKTQFILYLSSIISAIYGSDNSAVIEEGLFNLKDTSKFK